MKVDNYFEIYNRIDYIVKAILYGVDKSGSLGRVYRGSNGDYAFVEINYLSFGEELTKNIEIPYKILETGNGVDKFIHQQITDFLLF